MLLRSRHVRAVLEYYRPQLEPIYKSYAQSDSADIDSLDTINLKELIYMFKELLCIKYKV